MKKLLQLSGTGSSHQKLLDIDTGSKTTIILGGDAI